MKVFDNLLKDADDKVIASVPDLSINTDEETTETPSKESPVSILEKKLLEINTMFEENNIKLNEIASKKQQLNNEEEAVKYELSGLHGAKVVLQQLIEEAKDS